MKKQTLLLLLTTATPGFSASGLVTIVREGSPEAVIVLEASPTRAAQMGAFELRHHIHLITGAELPIVRGEEPAAGKMPIRIGGHNEGFRHEQTRVRITAREILLTGNDTENYETVDYMKPATFPQMSFEFKGSLYAVYDFLERECGVRFYAAEEHGTTFRKRSALAVAIADRQYCPPLDAFRMVHHSNRARSKLQHTARETALWQLRWRMTDFFGRTNHNMYGIFFAHWGQAQHDKALAEAFVERRPEYFAHGYQGKSAPADPILRRNYPNDPDLPPQLCYSNPGTVAYYAREVVTYFDGGNVRGGWRNFGGRTPTDQAVLPRIPDKPFFYPIQGGDTGGFCRCDDCTQRFAEQPENERTGNRKFQFIADVARAAASTHPGAGVSTLAYNRETLVYPKGVDLPENLSVQLCLTTYTWYHPGIRTHQEGIYREWIDKEAGRRPITLWTYIFSPHWDAQYHFGNFSSFPGLYPWKTAEQFQRFTQDGIRGWFTEVELQYNTLEAYVASRICFDPSIDAETMIDEYFQDYYGAAGAAMKALYRELEGAYWDWNNYPAAWREAWRDSAAVLGPRGRKHPSWGTGLHSPDVNWAIGSPERMAKLEGLIETATSLVATPAEKARLNRFIAHIWQDAREGRRQYMQQQVRKDAPPPELTATRVPDADGDPDRIDWSAVSSFSQWKGTYGNDLERAMELRAAADAKFLYLDFRQANAPGAEADIWFNNVEFFFAAQSALPAMHFAVAPSGKFVQLLHESVNDVPIMTEVDFGARFEVEKGDNAWRFRVSIPRDKLPAAVDKAGLVFNLMRTTRTTGSPAVMFCPIYTPSYLGGIDAFGRFRWPEERP